MSEFRVRVEGLDRKDIQGVSCEVSLGYGDGVTERFLRFVERQPDVTITWTGVDGTRWPVARWDSGGVACQMHGPHIKDLAVARAYDEQLKSGRLNLPPSPLQGAQIAAQREARRHFVANSEALVA